MPTRLEMIAGTFPDVTFQTPWHDLPRDDASGWNPLRRMATTGTPTTTGGIATHLYSSDQPARLRAADVMLYNPGEVDVAAFTSRLEFMPTLEGEGAVLTARATAQKIKLDQKNCGARKE
ncbi:hypothetical protein GX51_02806 [Blastomyces parvus]|uniref:Uncharacterized protein n=1 Tax=Blastomyces parvus TaxID=2060905 RepID=A0A2B7XAB9_9EURO|nr:hypothetical protein GX51_02806 [Blastomyces parvus]